MNFSLHVIVLPITFKASISFQFILICKILFPKKSRVRKYTIQTTYKHRHTHIHTHRKHTQTTSYKDQAVIRNVIQTIENQLSHDNSRRLRSKYIQMGNRGLDSPLLCQDYSRSEMIISDEKLAH